MPNASTSAAAAWREARVLEKGLRMFGKHPHRDQIGKCAEPEREHQHRPAERVAAGERDAEDAVNHSAREPTPERAQGECLRRRIDRKNATCPRLNTAP